jgi:membrane-associated phospholipid phosphatase
MKSTHFEPFPRFVRQNYYVIGVIGYASILLFNYFRYGLLFQYSLGYYALFALPIVIFLHTKSKFQEFLRSWVPFLVILLSYESLQGIVGSMVSQGDLYNLGALDQSLWGFNLTGTIQQAFLSSAISSLALFLYSLHFPLIVVASVSLWFAKRSLFDKYAISMVVTSFASLFLFAVMPSSPPWYQGMASNLVSAAGSSSASSFLSGSSILASYVHLTTLIEADKFAAFPSLHAAYMVLFCYFMMRFKPLLGIITIPLTFGVLFSTLYLGQHYLIDLIAGSALALSSAVIAEYAISRNETKKRGHDIVKTESKLV